MQMIVKKGQLVRAERSYLGLESSSMILTHRLSKERCN